MSTKADGIPIAYPTDKNTVQTGMGFGIFSAGDERRRVRSDRISSDGGTNAGDESGHEAKDDILELFGLTDTNKRDPAPREDMDDYEQRLWRMSDEELLDHLNTARGKREMQRFLVQVRGEEDGYAVVRGDDAFGAVAGAERGQDARPRDGRMGDGREQRRDKSSVSEANHTRTTDVTSGWMNGWDRQTLSTCHARGSAQSYSIVEERICSDRVHQTQEHSEAQELASELLESERWVSLEQPVTAPEMMRSDVWERYV